MIWLFLIVMLVIIILFLFAQKFSEWLNTQGVLMEPDEQSEAWRYLTKKELKQRDKKSRIKMNTQKINEFLFKIIVKCLCDKNQDINGAKLFICIISISAIMLIFAIFISILKGGI